MCESKAGDWRRGEIQDGRFVFVQYVLMHGELKIIKSSLSRA